MKYAAGRKRIEGLRKKIGALRRQMCAAQKAIEPEPVEDYVLKRASGGAARLSDLFGDKDTLFVIHNMGASCPYCTLWADGFSGVYKHLSDRAAFVVSSPDAPGKQRKFAAGRGWTFPMVSHDGTSFAADMGYRQADGWVPGVSVFKRRRGRILRVSDARFHPGDDFCAVWHFFDLLPEGADDWHPQFKYAR